MTKDQILWMDFCIDWLADEYKKSKGILFSKFVEKKFEEANRVNPASPTATLAIFKIVRKEIK